MIFAKSPARPAAVSRRRLGALMTTELLLTLPILMLLMAGMMGLCQVLTARQILATATGEGARVGALSGDAALARLAVQRTLAPHGPLAQADVNVQIRQVSDGAGGFVNVVVVVVSAPVGLALVGAPLSAVSGLADQNIVMISIMQVN